MIRFNNQSILIILIMLPIIMYTMACKKFLDEKPDSKLAVPTSLTQLQAILDFSTRMNVQRTPNFGEASTDDYFLLQTTYNSFSEEKREIYLWNRKEYDFQNDWSIAYEPIYNANYCLELVEKIQPTDGNIAQWENIRGSALFFRKRTIF